MKIKIWQEDDYFNFLGGPRIDMDPIVVECKEEPLPLTWNFDWEREPIGLVSNIRIEDGELVGDLEWIEGNTDFNDEKWETFKEFCRFGGYYSHVVRKVLSDGQEHVASGVLAGVSIVMKSKMPGVKL